MNDQELFELNLYNRYGLNPTLNEIQIFNARFERMLNCVIGGILAERLGEQDFVKYANFFAEGGAEKAEAFAASRGQDLMVLSLEEALSAKRKVLERQHITSVEELHRALKFALPETAAGVFDSVRDECWERVKLWIKEMGLSGPDAEKAFDNSVDTISNKCLCAVDDALSRQDFERFKQWGEVNGDISDMPYFLWALKVDLAEIFEKQTEAFMLEIAALQK